MKYILGTTEKLKIKVTSGSGLDMEDAYVWVGCIFIVSQSAQCSEHIVHYCKIMLQKSLGGPASPQRRCAPLDFNYI